MTAAARIDLATACLLLLLTVLAGLAEWGATLPAWLPAVVNVATLALLTLRVRWSRRAFVAAGALLTVLLAWQVPGWREVVLQGLRSATFIGAFFTALSTLRNVAETSPGIGAAGSFLAAQPPGRRYAALTLGGHLFALPLNYGAISLLGSLASTSARAEPDPVIRGHRTRRMLLAIQRGFISSLPWSPLAFAMAITTALIPGARWSEAAIPGVISALILAATGWALDTIFKPKVVLPPGSRPRPAGSWALLAPLAFLLLLLGTSVFALHEATGVRIVGVVMLVAPVLAFCWALIQHAGGALDFPMSKRLRDYICSDLPSNRGEVTLLMMAGYIGTVGAPLLSPLVMAAGLDLSAWPVWLVLAGLVWIIPVFGQLGMNPILAVTLIAPLIPDPEVMGVAPTAVVTAIAAGWAVSGASSPFTATTMLIGSFGNVSASHVGLRWNALYVPVVATLLTAWVLAYAFWPM